MKKIGHIRIEDGEERVHMGTADEAVVGIKMLPISTLITSPELRSLIEKLTLLFFNESQDYSCK